MKKLHTKRGRSLLNLLERVIASALMLGIIITTAPSPLVFAEEVLDPPSEEPALVEPTETPPPEEETTPPDGEDGTDVVETGGVEEVNTESGEEGGDTTTEADTTGEQTTVIDTGDAAAAADTENVVNTNVTETGDETPPVEVEMNTEEASLEENGEPEGEAGLTVENENDADVETAAMAGGSTGGNTITSGEGTSIIDTGDAIASANVVNVVNTNIVNSDGLLMLLNVLASMGSLDLREIGIFLEGLSMVDPTSCELDECGYSDQTILNSNNATITNDVTVLADTGSNTVDAGSGDGIVLTGNAYASANVVNVANTNIVNSNYLLLSFNNFGDWAGDIAFGEEVLAGLFGGNTMGGDLSIENHNTATVDNDISSTAQTGSNTSGGNGDSAVITGDADADAFTYNQVNTNLLNTDSLMIMIRVHGEWSGSVFGTPEGISWQETGSGVLLYSTPGEDIFGPSGGVSTDLTVENHNTAVVDNNVTVTALTGNNQIEAGDDSVIATGDAYASANVFNIVNTNIIGSNWLLAVFNIFGDWTGSIGFGEPECWLGGQAIKEAGELGPNGLVKLRYTIMNSGGFAEDVRLQDTFDRRVTEFVEASDGGIIRGDTVEWFLGELGAGETRIVEYLLRVRGDIGPGNTFFVNESLLSCSENEENENDNSEIITIVAHRPSSGGEYVEYTPRPDLRIEKTHNAPFGVELGDTVRYTITIENNGGLAYHATLYDMLANGQGDIIFEQNWPLDRIYPDEEVIIEYSVEYNGGTEPGTYTNYAWIEAIGGHPSLNPFYGNIADTEVVSATVQVLTEPPKSGGVVATAVEPPQDEPEGGGGGGTGWIDTFQELLSGHMSGLIAFAAPPTPEPVEELSAPEPPALLAVTEKSDDGHAVATVGSVVVGPERPEVIITTDMRALSEAEDEAFASIFTVEEVGGQAAAAVIGSGNGYSGWLGALLLILLIALMAGAVAARHYVLMHRKHHGHHSKHHAHV